MISIVPVEPTVGNKRKSAPTLEETDKIANKRQRSSEDDDLQPHSGSCVPFSSLENVSLNHVTNGQNGNANTESEKVNSYHKEGLDVETSEWDNEDVQNGDDRAPHACSGSVEHSSEVWLSSNGAGSPSLCPHFASPNVSNQSNVPALNKCGRTSSSQDIYSPHIQTPSPLCNERATSTEKDSLAADLPPGQDLNNFHSGSRDSSDELVPVPEQLLWRNRDNLCWLDSLLAVLLNSKSLRKLRPENEPQHSSVWRLLREHEDICAAIQARQQTDGDGVPRVASHVLQSALDDLQSLRMSIFKLLQPKLHCKLGQRESPVFAMPLLLALDSLVERLFQTTYLWEFKCSECKVVTKERVVKTLPTFTNIVPDWTPLNAVHFAPCNMCSKRNQMRAMLLENVAPVFALHFVEGLPNNDVSSYTFSFKGKRYSVTAVIQYNHKLKHFITWFSNEDGSWLEYDDLKHPVCETYQTLQIPAEEIHIVFWEVEEDAPHSVCSPSDTSPEPGASEIEGVLSFVDPSAEEPSAQTLDESLLTPHSDTDIVCALSGDTVVDTTVTAEVNSSIGASTLLDTFEGLTHSDIITLTLVELQPDSLQSKMQPLKEIQATKVASEDPSPVKTEKVVSSPDSSIPAASGDLCPHTDTQSAPSISPCVSESEDSSASDPTFVPSIKNPRGKRPNQRKTVSRQRGKKAASSKDAPPELTEPPKPLTSAQNNTVPVTGQTSMVSSTNSPPLNTQKDRWSFILSKHTEKNYYKNVSHPPPTQNRAVISEVKPSHPFHSTPNPVKKPPIPSVVPKAPLIPEEGKGFPPKAAEMYDGFGAKNSNPVVPLPSSLSTPPLLPPVPISQQTPLTWTSSTSPPSLTEISSCKKLGGSKVPSLLGDTETLRYKLLKKLKAKKKKLAKLNQLLGNGGGDHPLRPDSTDLSSPTTVSSSTYDRSTADDILSDLLSPATTASNLSPDSTGFLEMLASGQDGANQLDHVVNGAAVSQMDYQTNQQEDHNFLEDFLSQF